MQSSNPVFARNDNFNGKTRATATTDPSQWQIDLNGGGPPQSSTDDRRMTLDSVVEKTGITLGVLTLAAAVTWFMVGNIDTQSALNKAFGFAMGGALIGFALAMVNSFKKVISPGLVLAYAVVEGVFVGAFSKIISNYVGGDPMIVFQAVTATIIAFAGTLFAYKFFNIQVTAKFRKVMTIAMFSFVGVMVLNLILSLTGFLGDGGLRNMGGLGLLFSAIAVVLAVFMLILDFDMVERGIAAGAPERESWRAAFGLTVTLVWLYIEILRILAILRGDN